MVLARGESRNYVFVGRNCEIIAFKMGEKAGDKQLESLCKLFIGGLSRSVTDDELRDYFLQYTDDEVLNDCVVIKDPHSQESRGFGFVTYNRLSDADNCLANCPHTISGKETEVKHAIPRDEKNPANHSRTNKVFVGGLPKEATEDDIKEAVENFVLDCGEPLNAKITKVEIIMTKKEDGPDPPVSRGFAFLDMASNEDADKVVIVKHFTIAGKSVELKKAEPKGGSGQGGRGGNRSTGGRNSGQFGGGGVGSWAGGYNNYSSPYGDYGFSGYGNGYGGGYGGGFGQYQPQASGFGPSRGGRSRGRGRGGNPY